MGNRLEQKFEKEAARTSVKLKEKKADKYVDVKRETYALFHLRFTNKEEGKERERERKLKFSLLG